MQIIATVSTPVGSCLHGGEYTETTVGPYAELVQFDVDLFAEDFNYQYRIDDGPLITNWGCSAGGLYPYNGDSPDGSIQHLQFVTPPAQKIWVRVDEAGQWKYCDADGYKIVVIKGSVPVVAPHADYGYVGPVNPDPTCPFVDPCGGLPCPSTDTPPG